jgi:tetrahydromethanopterin S-methyltransferase subunit C
MVALQVIAISSVYRGEYVPDEYELQAITTCMYPPLAYAVEERSLHQPFYACKVDALE